ncbi:MAG: hypothetical protein J6P73_09250 [Bacteroidales bacterium]|nr:hypothetical protein [Bacteroidales bacterium]
MESIITQLARQETWEEFLAYRLHKGRFTWHEFEDADTYVEKEQYLPMAQRIVKEEALEIPTKKIINKMGTGKKRVVYSFNAEEMKLLKLIAHLLYRYDNHFASNCYAFRRGVRAHDAIVNINKAIQGQKMWAYKIDIHDYFNSIPIPRLLPMLADLLADDPPLYRFFERMLTVDQAVYNGQVVEEKRGVMAGTPTAPFLANVYLSDVDYFFEKAGVVYARYSDDIILFAPDEALLNQHKAALLRLIAEHGLEVNPSKEKVFTPDEAYEFLGFSCHGNDIDIAASTKQKMKGKISRKARSLMRWQSRNGIGSACAMKAMINCFNHKFFESDDPETLTWSRWFFPVITQTEGLKEIDHYLQQNIRFLSTGRHSKANYRISFDQLKELGYKSLVNEFYKNIII